MYNLLLGLPLFLGINRTRLTEIIEKTRFHFIKYKAGETIVRKNEPCTHMKYVISGQIQTQMRCHNDKIQVFEEFGPQTIIAPNFFFGHNTFYPYDVIAVEDTGIMQIDKASLISLMQKDEVMLINMLNITSRQAQRHFDSYTFMNQNDMAQKLACWLLNYTSAKSENIRFVCRQKDIYTLFGIQRMVFLNALEELKNSGVIDFDNREIRVIDRRELAKIADLPQVPTMPIYQRSPFKN